MKRFIGMLAFAVLLSFGTGTLVYAGDPPKPTPSPGPTDGTKKPSPPKLSAGDEKKDEKKDENKGGK